jgi:integrase
MKRRGHGDGGIDQRGENRWRLRWRVDGKRYSKSYEGTRKEAQAELRRLLKTVDDGTHVAPDKITLGAWVESWLTLLRRGDRSRRGLVSGQTLERYETLLRVRVLPVLGDRPLQRLTATEIDTLYIWLGERLAPGTVRITHAILGSCLDAAVRKGLILHNPTDRAEAPRAGDGEAGRVLDQEELATLLAGFRGKALYPIVVMAARTGMRRNEILALRWSDVDLANKSLSVTRSLELTKAHGWRFKEPKTRRGRRTIVIDAALADLLSAVREKYVRVVAGVIDGTDVDLSLIKLPEDALVFPSMAGDLLDLTRPRHPHSVTAEFVERARKLGFEGLRFHDLRGTHETLLLDAGVPVHTVAARCGHDPAVMLRVYARRTKKADASAAEVIGAVFKGIL